MTKKNETLLIRRLENGSELLYSDGSVRTYKEKPLALLNQRCLQLGADAEGRMASFRHVLGVRQKAAILVDELKQEIWFPTLSMKAKDCLWISYSQILSVTSNGPHRCLIRFFSGETFETDIDPRTIRLQMKRCRAYLEKISENHINP